MLVGQTTSTCFGCCHPPDLPGQLPKARAAPRCVSLLCSTGLAFWLCGALGGHAAASSQRFHDDEIPMVCPACGRQHQGCVTLFLISSYELPQLATGLLAGWTFSLVWWFLCFQCLGSQRAHSRPWLLPGFYICHHRSNPQGPEKAAGRLLQI